MTLPLRQRPRITPEAERVPVGLTKAAQAAINDFLKHDMAATGIGFSEFILATRQLLSETSAHTRLKPAHHGFLKEDALIKIAPSAKTALAEIGRIGGTTRSDSIFWAIALWRETGISEAADRS